MAERRHPPAVVLVRPREQGNLGAAARAMANMGLGELLVVEPGAPAGDTARAFAAGAGAILADHRRAASLAEALAPFQRVVGTTSVRDRLSRAPVVEPRELPDLLAQDPAPTRTALVFGPEVSGLTTEELARCSPLVRVPCAPEQPTLNLSQAVLIVAYELFLARSSEHLPSALGVAPREPPATRDELEGLVAHVETLLHEVGFARDDTFRGVLRDLRQLAARTSPDRRELTILRGICRRILGALERAGGPR